MNSSRASLPGSSHGRRLLPAVFLAIVLLVTGGVAAHAQGSKVNSAYQPIRDEDSDHPRQRDQWFMRGRALPGQSAAALRYRAYQHKLQMRAQRAAALKAQEKSTPFASSSGTGWVPLGPSPLASDASGSGFQDYGPVSGRATSVLADPADATGNTLLLGGAFGGLWRSQNAASGSYGNATGVTWTPLTDNQPSLAVGAIALQPNNGSNIDNVNHLSKVVLVGTGEANSAGDSYYGVGILRSADAGNTWTLINSGDGGTHPFLGLGFTRIAFSTANPNLVVAASAAASVGAEDGAIANSTRGLYTSTDGGLHWSFALPKDPGGSSISVASATTVIFNSSNNTFYAVMRYHALYSSTDGVNWTRLSNQPGGTILSTANCPATLPSTPTCPIYRGELAVVPTRNEMYIWYVDVNENDQGIYRTRDGGNTWTQINETGLTVCGDTRGCGTEQGLYNLELVAVPSGTTTDLYAGAVNLFKCTSLTSGSTACNGGSWLNLTHVYGCTNPGSIAHVHPDQHGVAFALPSSGHALMYFANDGGIYRALDAYTGLATGSCGQTNQFDSLNGTLGSMTQFVSFSIHPTDANTVLGGTQDNGSPATAAALSHSNWGNVLSGDGGYNAINPSNTSEWFAANTNVTIQHCTLGASCHSQDFTDVVNNSTVGGDDGPFYTPYILDPQNSSEIVVGTCRVWRGTTTGSGFSALSNNFDTGSSAVCPTGSASVAPAVNQVRGLAAGGPKDSGTGFSKVIYATTEGIGPLQGTAPVVNGRVFASTNAATGGPSSWSDVTGSINPNNYVISSVAMDGSDATGKTAYVTVMGFMGSVNSLPGVTKSGHVWKTTNAGQSWTDFTGTGSAALPDAPANAVVVDASAAMVYVGTDVGVFTSSTTSPNWTEIGPAAAPGASGYLPNVPVTALRLFSTVNSKRLRASTYGRGIWEFVLFAGPDYEINVSNSPLSIFPGQSATFNGSLVALNGYASSVALTCAGTAPPGCTVAPPNGIPTISGLAFSVTTGTIGAVANYQFDVHGVGSDTNVVTHDAPTLLQVVDFAIAPPSPATVQVVQGFSSQPVQVQVSGLGAFNGTVNLSCGGLPAGATCTFDNATPTVSSTPVTVNLTIITTGSTPLGTTNITVSASVPGAPAPKTQSLAVVVTATGYSMTVSNKALSALDGKIATYTGTLTAQNGYSSTVQISCSGSTVPGSCTPVTATPSPSGQSFALGVSNSSPGTLSFNIQAVGTDTNTFTQIQPVTLTVTQDFAISAAPSSQNATAGQTVTYNLSVGPAGNAFSSAVAFSCASITPSASPAPTCSFNPPSVTPGSSAKSVVLSVATTAPHAALQKRGLFYTTGLPLAGVVFVFAGLMAGGAQWKPRAWSLVAGVGLLCILFLSACGGGGNNVGGAGGGGGGTGGTPKGTYTITISGTSGGLSHTTTVSLTVQ